MVHSITSATARRNKPISRKIHLWKRADMDALRRGCTELATTFCQTFHATSQIQDMWTFIKTHLLILQDHHVPSKPVLNKIFPVMDKQGSKKFI
jgi:hypothetical protein